MKICPKCSQTYGDETLNYCLMDGEVLQPIAAGDDSARTVSMPQPNVTSGNRQFSEQQTAMYSVAPPPKKSRAAIWLVALFAAAVILVGGGMLALLGFGIYTASQEDRRRHTPYPTPSYSPLPAFTPVPMPSIMGPPAPPTTDSSYLTMEKFNQLKVGMPLAEVERILGGKGIVVSPPSGTAELKFSVLKWEGDNYKSIILSFENDKIMTKSQVGLK